MADVRFALARAVVPAAAVGGTFQFVAATAGSDFTPIAAIINSGNSTALDQRGTNERNGVVWAGGFTDGVNQRGWLTMGATTSSARRKVRVTNRCALASTANPLDPSAGELSFVSFEQNTGQAAITVNVNEADSDMVYHVLLIGGSDGQAYVGDFQLLSTGGVYDVNDPPFPVEHMYGGWLFASNPNVLQQSIGWALNIQSGTTEYACVVTGGFENTTNYHGGLIFDQWANGIRADTNLISWWCELGPNVNGFQVDGTAAQPGSNQTIDYIAFNFNGHGATAGVIGGRSGAGDLLITNVGFPSAYIGILSGTRPTAGLVETQSQSFGHYSCTGDLEQHSIGARDQNSVASGTVARSFTWDAGHSYNSAASQPLEEFVIDAINADGWNMAYGPAASATAFDLLYVAFDEPTAAPAPGYETQTIV